MEKITALYFFRLSRSLSPSVTAGLKILFDEKHLYQHVEVKFPQFERLWGEIKPKLRVASMQLEGIKQVINGCYEASQSCNWIIEERPEYFTSEEDIERHSGDLPINIEFCPPDVKTFCDKCDRVEAFNCVATHDCYNSYTTAMSARQVYPGDNIWSFCYLCQSCKKFHVDFLVRRQSLKLMLVGRTPIEKVKAPTYIPNKQKDYYEDAVLAFQSRAYLPSVFLLRCLIEQYVRSYTGDFTSQRVDILINSYMEDLDDDFKSRFPSLREIYDRLSEKIHEGDLTKAAGDVYEDQKIKIDEHFDAKRVFKIENYK